MVCLDNFFTGRRQNIEHLLDSHRFELVRHDVCDPILFEVDEVFHLACPASPVHYQKNPVRTIRTCVQGTLNMLDMAARWGPASCIASTSEVYGDPLMHPQVEGYWGNVNPIGPRACYDEGKRCAEALTVVLRPPVQRAACASPASSTPTARACWRTTGAWSRTSSCQALRGTPITIFGDGQQTRSFCYVDDLIDGFVRLMESPEEAPVNLGNPGEFTMLELAQKVRALTGSRSPLVHEPLPTDDPVRRRPDISRAVEVLGWRPTVPLEEGLTRTVQDFRRRIDGGG